MKFFARVPARAIVRTVHWYLCLTFVFAGCELRGSIGNTPPLTTVSTAIKNIQRQRKVDLLFMLDNSPSMTPAQAELKKQFPQLISKLQSFQQNGSAASYHIGVITSDLGAGPTSIGAGACNPGGQGGKLQVLPAAAIDPMNCAMLSKDTVTGLAANYIDYDQTRSVDNLPIGQTLADTFSCMASVGGGGCGFEHQLEAVYRALHEPPPENEGFLREDAVLGVIFLTDEDDCSAHPNTDLFDASKSDYGVANSSFRCTQFGLQHGMPAQFPLPDIEGTLVDVAPAANPTQSSFGHLFDVNRYINFFNMPSANGGIKEDPNDVFLVSISGPVIENSITIKEANPCTSNTMVASCAALQHSCVSVPNSSFVGDPAVRINAVVNAATNHVTRSICDTPYSSTFDELATYIAGQLTGGCIPAPLALENNVARCSVFDQTSHPDGPATQTAMAECRGASPIEVPCWKLITDTSCPAAHNASTGKDERFALVVCRDDACTPNLAAPIGVTTEASCDLLVSP